MKLRLIAVGTKMPTWVETGYLEYAKRLPPGFALHLLEIPAEKRLKQTNIARITEKEGEKILQAIHPGSLVIALDVKGKSFTTEQLAHAMQNWRDENRNVDILVGGPDGLATACLRKAQQKWSLSALTLPHPLVRILVAEQIYRAFSILHNHPYHR
ncbi:MAG: 23S rRNA (pseudouridine(1915)-N(3))-methyltransferase RlmH [Pseudomonadota bacterium]